MTSALVGPSNTLQCLRWVSNQPFVARGSIRIPIGASASSPISPPTPLLVSALECGNAAWSLRSATITSSATRCRESDDATSSSAPDHTTALRKLLQRQRTIDDSDSESELDDLESHRVASNDTARNSSAASATPKERANVSGEAVFSSLHHMMQSGFAAIQTLRHSTNSDRLQHAADASQFGSCSVLPERYMWSLPSSRAGRSKIPTPVSRVVAPSGPPSYAIRAISTCFEALGIAYASVRECIIREEIQFSPVHASVCGIMSSIAGLSSIADEIAQLEASLSTVSASALTWADTGHSVVAPSSATMALLAHSQKSTKDFINSAGRAIDALRVCGDSSIAASGNILNDVNAISIRQAMLHVLGASAALSHWLMSDSWSDARQEFAWLGVGVRSATF